MGKGKLFSPGKLLLTSEYFVLDGALALAVPTKLGQEFSYEEIEDGNSLIVWDAFHLGELWLHAEINYKEWQVLTPKSESADFIKKVLQNVQALSQSKFKASTSYHLKTNIQFPANFGLGSSSTLMNNLADWAGIDAFILNERSLGGSGYDIAVAKWKTPILYQKMGQKREVVSVPYSPSFKEDLIFIHLNQKQDSREGINLYKQKPKSTDLIEEFTAMTKKVVNCKSLGEFSDLMEIHEDLVSNFIGLETVKNRFFNDCPVFIKSLGAWGGDFVISQKFPEYEAYFYTRGFKNIFSYSELIL